MIECSRGMGRLLPKICARRWLIANDLEPGDVGSAAHICKPCPDGEKRAELVQLKPRAPLATSLLNGAADRPCQFCGTTYRPNNRRQKYCASDDCKIKRTRLASMRAYQTSTGKPVTPWPKFGRNEKAPAHR